MHIACLINPIKKSSSSRPGRGGGGVGRGGGGVDRGGGGGGVGRGGGGGWWVAVAVAVRVWGTGGEAEYKSARNPKFRVTGALSGSREREPVSGNPGVGP